MKKGVYVTDNGSVTNTCSWAWCRKGVYVTDKQWSDTERGSMSQINNGWDSNICIRRTDAEMGPLSQIYNGSFTNTWKCAKSTCRCKKWGLFIDPCKRRKKIQLMHIFNGKEGTFKLFEVLKEKRTGFFCIQKMVIWGKRLMGSNEIKCLWQIAKPKLQCLASTSDVTLFDPWSLPKM